MQHLLVSYEKLYKCSGFYMILRVQFFAFFFQFLQFQLQTLAPFSQSDKVILIQVTRIQKVTNAMFQALKIILIFLYIQKMKGGQL